MRFLTVLTVYLQRYYLGDPLRPFIAPNTRIEWGSALSSYRIRLTLHDLRSPTLRSNNLCEAGRQAYARGVGVTAQWEEVDRTVVSALRLRIYELDLMLFRRRKVEAITLAL